MNDVIATYIFTPPTLVGCLGNHSIGVIACGPSNAEDARISDEPCMHLSIGGNNLM